MAGQRNVDKRSVFLNVPYDAGYERLFVALVVALVSLGRKPRCVIEVVDNGQGRMDRIAALMSKCRVSIHDLCRVGLPVRFNMPFELGIAYALNKFQGQHDFILLERRKHRLDKTLSDIKYVDPKTHDCKPLLALSCVYEVLAKPSGNPDIAIVERIYKRLVKELDRIRHGRKTIFNRYSYYELLAGTLLLCKQQGLIKE